MLAILLACIAALTGVGFWRARAGRGSGLDFGLLLVWSIASVAVLIGFVAVIAPRLTGPRDTLLAVVTSAAIGAGCLAAYSLGCTLGIRRSGGVAGASHLPTPTRAIPTLERVGHRAAQSLVGGTAAYVIYCLLARVSPLQRLDLLAGWTTGVSFIYIAAWMNSLRRRWRRTGES